MSVKDGKGLLSDAPQALVWALMISLAMVALGIGLRLAHAGPYVGDFLIGPAYAESDAMRQERADMIRNNEKVQARLLCRDQAWRRAEDRADNCSNLPRALIDNCVQFNRQTEAQDYRECNQR